MAEEAKAHGGRSGMAELELELELDSLGILGASQPRSTAAAVPRNFLPLTS